MLDSLASLIIALFLLLPGAHARQAALRATPQPWSASYRSTLQELVEILAYAMANALLSVSTLTAIAVAFFGKAKDLDRLITKGLADFPVERRTEGIVWVVAYFVIALIIAEITGSSQLWIRMRATLAQIFAYSDTWTHSTIWYAAIEAAREDDPNHEVAVQARMDDGSEYIGVLDEYPVAEDDKAKDFVLQDARRRPEGAAEFESVSPATRTILNSKHCVALHVGPNARPLRPEKVEWWPPLVHSVMWLALVSLAARAYLSIADQPQTDLLRLLGLVVLWLTVGATLGFVRVQLRDVWRVWDRPIVQTLWSFSGAFFALGAAAVATSVTLAAIAMTGLAVSSLIALLIAGRAREEEPQPEAS